MGVSRHRRPAYCERLIWAVEAMSKSQNVYVSVLMIVLHSLGAWFCYSVRRKHKHKSDNAIARCVSIGIYNHLRCGFWNSG